MPITNLLAKIERDALREGEEILAEARRKAERIMAEAKEKARESAAAVLREYEEASSRKCAEEMSAALNGGKSALLESQEMLLRETIEEAMRRFDNLPQDRIRAWLKGIIMKNAEGGEVIIASEKDRGILESGLLEEINREMEASGSMGGLVLTDERPTFRRGVILRGKRTRNDLSIERLMEELVRENEEELLGMLFGEMDIRGGTMRVKYRCS